MPIFFYTFAKNFTTMNNDMFFILVALAIALSPFYFLVAMIPVLFLTHVFEHVGRWCGMFNKWMEWKPDKESMRVANLARGCLIATACLVALWIVVAIIILII